MSASAASDRAGPFGTVSSPNAPRHEPIKVAIIDDEDEWRFLLEQIVEGLHEFRCVGSFRSGEEAIGEVPGVCPEIVLMDIRMPGISGIECLRRLKAMLPGLIVVLASGLVDAEIISEALSAGGNGYLTKPFAPSQCLATLMASMRRCISGEQESVEITGLTAKGDRACARLTDREKEVMRRLEKGMPYKEIADELGVSFSTVHFHLHNIYGKLQASNRTEAVINWRDTNRT